MNEENRQLKERINWRDGPWELIPGKFRKNLIINHYENCNYKRKCKCYKCSKCKSNNITNIAMMGMGENTIESLSYLSQQDVKDYFLKVFLCTSIECICIMRSEKKSCRNIYKTWCLLWTLEGKSRIGKKKNLLINTFEQYEISAVLL